MVEIFGTDSDIVKTTVIKKITTIKFGESLLPFGSKYFAFPVAI
jgi:hypothetical protein